MGVVKLPWVPEHVFTKLAFNYCDHFGDKKILVRFCKVCREEEERKEKYKRAGKDPYDLRNVFADIRRDMEKTVIMLHKKAKEWGVNLNTLDDDGDEEIEPQDFPIYRLVEKYGFLVGENINKIYPVWERHKVKLLKEALEVLGHSRSYVLAKIYRAIFSKQEEDNDEMLREIPDSKTSAFFAYLGIKRNYLIAIKLSQVFEDLTLKEKFLKFADISLELCEQIRREFFPNDALEYKEWGCSDESYCPS